MHDHADELMNNPEPDLDSGIATDEVLTSKSATLFAVVLGILCITVIIIAVFFVRWWGPQDTSPLASTDIARQRPTQMPAPKLQQLPGEEMKKYSETVISQMDEYGWVNKEKGIVHIPIERAIEAVAEKGLPARAGNGK